VTVRLPGASPATTPRPTRLTKAALRKLPKLRISIGVPKLIRRGAQTIVPVALSRAVHGTLATVQLRRGVGHLTVARGRVAGRRMPIALSSRSAGRYLLRVRFQEARKGTATEVVEIVVR
jgi:hypothetical protein